MKYFLFSFFLLIHLSPRPTMASIFLQSLGTQPSTYFKDLKEKSSLLVFFTADCPHCEKQVESLGCLDSKTPVVLLGLGAESKLKKMQKFGYRTYKISKKAKDQLGFTENLSPQIQYKEKVLLGFKTCEKVKDWMRQK